MCTFPPLPNKLRYVCVKRSNVFVEKVAKKKKIITAFADSKEINKVEACVNCAYVYENDAKKKDE